MWEMVMMMIMMVMVEMEMFVMVVEMEMFCDGGDDGGNKQQPQPPPSGGRCAATTSAPFPIQLNVNGNSKDRMCSHLRWCSTNSAIFFSWFWATPLSLTVSCVLKYLEYCQSGFLKKMFQYF